jgi:hypothetical protein
MLHVSKACPDAVTTFDFSTLPKHATRCIVIYGGLEAATVILPATPLTRRTSLLDGRWVAQGCSAKPEPAALHMAATGAAWVVLPQRLSLACLD